MEGAAVVVRQFMLFVSMRNACRFVRWSVVGLRSRYLSATTGGHFVEDMRWRGINQGKGIVK